MKLRISESALSKFVTCEEQFRLSRLWRRSHVTPRSPQAEGSEVHAILAGKQENKPSSSKVARFVSSLGSQEKSMGVNIVGREVEQEFPLSGEVSVMRIIDAYGYDKDGRPVLIDYKTTSSSRAWEPFNGQVPPLALGWQSSMYLLPPPPDFDTPFDKWPTIIYFLVSSPYEPIGIFGVEWSKRRQNELIDKISQVNDYVQRTKYRTATRTFGYHCSNCDFLAACYGVKGWENEFVRREEHG